MGVRILVLTQAVLEGGCPGEFWDLSSQTSLPTPGHRGRKIGRMNGTVTQAARVTWHCAPTQPLWPVPLITFTRLTWPSATADSSPSASDPLWGIPLPHTSPHTTLPCSQFSDLTPSPVLVAVCGCQMATLLTHWVSALERRCASGSWVTTEQCLLLVFSHSLLGLSEPDLPLT